MGGRGGGRAGLGDEESEEGVEGESVMGGWGGGKGRGGRWWVRVSG